MFEKELKKTIQKIDQLRNKDLELITWGAPIISFGSIESSKVATLGINPSDKEFIDDHGNEITGKKRRFHSLNSLGIKEWSEIESSHIQSIKKLCEDYFMNNPYDRWFKELDYIISGANTSYYFPYNSACHLDLVPFATKTKWGKLDSRQKKYLLDENVEILGELIEKSSIKFLVLNGKSVIENFSKISDIEFKITKQSGWSLPRSNGKNITGYSYSGRVNKLGGQRLSKELVVLGFNHNIQSSYGVTSKVKLEIRKWVSKEVSVYESN